MVMQFVCFGLFYTFIFQNFCTLKAESIAFQCRL